MSAKDVTERVVTDENGNEVQLPIASTDVAGIASFDSEDFTVTDEGKVKSLQKVGAIQYLGVPEPTSSATCKWTLSENSLAPIDEVRPGQYVMATQTVESDYGDIVTGDVFLIESVVGGVVTTSMTLVTALRGPQGEKGDKGDKGEKGDTGEFGSLSVGTVITGEPGTNADVKISGEPGNQVADFTIPRGDVGPVGPQGEQGIQGEKGEKGETGADGSSFVINKECDYATDLPTASEELAGTAYFVGVSEPRDVYVCVYDEDEQEYRWSNQGPLSGTQGIQGEKGEDGIDGEDGKDALVINNYETDSVPVVNKEYTITYTVDTFSREPGLADRFVLVWKDTSTGYVYLVTGVVTYIEGTTVNFDVLAITSVNDMLQIEVDKVGTETVGSESTPIYLKDGVPTEVDTDNMSVGKATHATSADSATGADWLIYSQLTSDDDLDEVLLEGYYKWGNSVPSNAPCAYGVMLIVYQSSTNYSKQIVFRQGSDATGNYDTYTCEEIYIRTRIGGTSWSDWNVIPVSTGTYSDMSVGSANLLNPIASENTTKIAVATLTHNSSGTASFMYVSQPNANNYGCDVLIGGNGATVIGAGESGGSCFEEILSNGGEYMYITSDQTITFYTNANTYANKKTFTMNNDGTMTLGASPLASDDSTKAATTEWVNDKINAIFSYSNGTLTITTS